MRGFVILPLFRGSSFQLYGGRYLDIPEGMIGVNMAVEINRPCEVSIPTVDFNVPSVDAMSTGLYKTVEFIVEGNAVYAGCAGGVGRTGLLLALVCKAWGISDPINYVRAQYCAHAVETEQQRKYVEQFVIDPKIKFLILWTKIKNLLKANKLLTKQKYRL